METDTPPPVAVNRARVLTLWATVVAERLGYPPETALTLGRPAAARIRRRRQWRLAGSPNCRAGHDTDRVRQPKFRDPSSEIAVVAIRRVSQCRRLAARRLPEPGASAARRSLAWSGNRMSAGTLATVRRTGSSAQSFGRYRSIGNGQAALMSGHRQTYRYLTVVLLAQLTAILPGHTDRVTALLRKASVIDDPGLDWLVSGDRWQYRSRTRVSTA